jgi:aminopeptidase N
MKYFLFFFFSTLSFGQQISKVDFIKCNAFVTPNFDLKSVDGTVSYEFKVLSEIDSIRIDAKNMDFKDVLINGKPVNYKNNKKELILFEGFKKGKNKVSFEYKSTPKQTVYFTGIGDGQQIWTQGQGKYTSHWLPSFDDVNEKVIFNISINYDKKFIAISNGLRAGVDTKYNEIPNYNNRTWNFEMKKPMSSYLLMLAIGKFEHQTETSKSGIPLENYYKPIDADKYQYTYKASKTIFDFLEKEIGVKYPWQIYRQIPVEDFLYAGMENTSSTIFAQECVVDENSFNDRNYINVNAHELAHQWFGDVVTAKSGKHHWLQEGFATYYALLAEREVFGDDYFYNALYRNSLLLRKEAKTDTVPILNEKASSYSFYQKGAWALHVIRESIGEKKFQKAVKMYLKKYKFKNVETADFLNEIAKVSDFDIVKFQKEWLEDYHFQTEQVNTLLKKSEFIPTLFEIQAQKNKPYEEKVAYFTEIMKSNGFYTLKKEIINQIVTVPFEQKEVLIRLAMQTNDIEVRQSVAETISKIPFQFKSDYESLLHDKSYDTKQIAFMRLWKSFPDEQLKYLNIAKDWVGKNDKELRILYITAYLNYADQHQENQNLSPFCLKYLRELIDYTSPKYESSIRQNALENFLTMYPKNAEVLKNLVNGTTHHKWQFVKYCRDEIRSLLKKENAKQIFQDILLELSELEQFQLKRILEE